MVKRHSDGPNSFRNQMLTFFWLKNDKTLDLTSGFEFCFEIEDEC